MAKGRKLLERYAVQVVELQDCVAVLFDFIVDELDPDPAPIDAYFADAQLGAVAMRALRESRFRTRVAAVGDAANRPARARDAFLRSVRPPARGGPDE